MSATVFSFEEAHRAREAEFAKRRERRIAEMLKHFPQRRIDKMLKQLARRLPEAANT